MKCENLHLIIFVFYFSKEGDMKILFGLFVYFFVYLFICLCFSACLDFVEEGDVKICQRWRVSNWRKSFQDFVEFVEGGELAQEFIMM